MLRISIFLIALGFAVQASAGEENAQRGFERDFFGVHVLNNFGIGEKRFASLSDSQKRSLLQARRSLVAFLKATQNPNADLTPFLGTKLRSNFNSREQLLNKLLGQETEILVTAVTGFDRMQPEDIQLNYYVVLFSEGNLLLREDVATLQKQGVVWRVTTIGGLK